MFCEKCGAEIIGDEKFCGSCGAPVAMQPADRVKETTTAKAKSAPTSAGTAHGKAQKQKHDLDVRWIIGLAASIVQVLCITTIPQYTYKGDIYTGLTALRPVIVIPFLILSILNVVFFLLRKYKGVLICNIFCVLYALIEVMHIYMYTEYTYVSPGAALFLYPIMTVVVFIGRSGHKKEAA